MPLRLRLQQLLQRRLRRVLVDVRHGVNRFRRRRRRIHFAVIVGFDSRMFALKNRSQFDPAFVGFAARGRDHVVRPTRLLPAILQLLLLLLEQFDGGLTLVHFLGG